MYARGGREEQWRDIRRADMRGLMCIERHSPACRVLTGKAYNKSCLEGKMSSCGSSPTAGSFGPHCLVESGQRAVVSANCRCIFIAGGARCPWQRSAYTPIIEKGWRVRQADCCMSAAHHEHAGCLRSGQSQEHCRRLVWSIKMQAGPTILTFFACSPACPLQAAATH